MNIKFALTALCAGLMLAAAPLAAGETGSAASVLVDCRARALPSQRQIGEMTGQANFSQVYATRARLMAEVGRACRKPNAGQVRLVPEETQQGSAQASRALVRQQKPRR